MNAKMIQGRLAPLAATALLALAGCSSGGGEPNPIFSTAKALLPAITGQEDDAAAAALPPGFSPEEIAANPDAYALVTVPAMFPAGLARLTGSRDGMLTWQSQYGFSVSYRDGMLVATRGLGFDLMAADARQTLAALQAGGGTVQRRHETLGSNDEVISTTYDCQLVRGAIEEVDLGLRKASGRAFTETCLGGGVQFENLYWLDESGQILTSRQFSTLTVAYLRANPL